MTPDRSRGQVAPTRPVLRWHGGKWKLAPQILPYFPPHRVYVESFGGAASMLLRKWRVYAEVYNDLDDEVVTLFRVLRDRAKAEQLRDLLRLTPFARSEFRAAYEMTDDPVERSRRLIIRSFMGFGSNAHATEQKGHRSTGFRANSSRSGTTPARGNRYDLAWRMYRHELSRDDHAELLTFLAELDGMVVLSGYPDPLYNERLASWRRVEIDAYADGARPRIEVLWINPAAVDALAKRHAGAGSPLFTHEAAAP